MVYQDLGRYEQAAKLLDLLEMSHLGNDTFKYLQVPA